MLCLYINSILYIHPGKVFEIAEENSKSLRKYRWAIYPEDKTIFKPGNKLLIQISKVIAN